MKHAVSISLALVAGTPLAIAQPAPADRPSSAPADAPPAGAAPASAEPSPSAPALTALPRESAIENPLGRSSAIVGSAFGGYGELTYNNASNADAVIDMRRFVLFFGHDFTEHLRFYSEVEVEHAIASSSDAGEMEIEQAYLDGLFSKRLNVRGGLILMPMGIINVYHEPPSFNGVDRPDVDQLVIPSTWREPGFGIFGELAQGLRYQLYLVNGFNANGFTAEAAIHDGHQEAQLANGGDFGVIGRLDYEPVLGTVLGVSAYGGTSGNTLRDAVGRVPIGMFDVDARYHHKGFSARAELAVLLVGDTQALNTALEAGTPDQQAAGPVAARSQGGYAEIAYDTMRLLAPASDQGLDVFTRFDYADTQASVLGGRMALDEFKRESLMIGLVYRPIPQIGIKLDGRRHFVTGGDSFNELATAITWLF
jgi:hypothetical protein